ncbi:MAG TPA: AAA family ATPase [Dehalococcoidia bacterium]|nr:AAA family ATPase [Dehalococcoidia bacterium]
MSDDTLPPYVRGLLEPSAYPEPPASVELAQTHISYVFLAGDVVYKTKKPVDFGFISQLTPEAREQYCHDEVRLNSRLAPDVYLGVVPVVRRADGRFAVESEGEVVEWAVKMRRLPDDRTLDRILAGEGPPPRLAERLVQTLIAFHEAAAVVPNDPEYAGGPGERKWWSREYGEAAGFIGDTWRAEDAEATKAFFDETIEAQQALFDQRLADGRVVEGHGDLHAKHVYLLEGGEQVAIVDCIEFTDWFHFRYLDVGYDIAFLAMDLEARGFPELGDEVAGRYIAAACDETMGVLQPLHRAFRAFVRGKVESIGAHATEISTEERERLWASAAAYFRLAASFGGRRAAPCVVVMSGLPATGKSTVAATLAGRIGAAYLSSDATRKQLAGLNPRERAAAEFRSGLYNAEMTERTYEELRTRAHVHLEAGRPVVIDAMHGRASERAAAIEMARAHGVPALIVELRLDDEAARARIEGREDDPLRTSDATWEVYERQRGQFEAVGTSEGPHLVLDATLPPAASARAIAERLPARS